MKKKLFVLVTVCLLMAASWGLCQEKEKVQVIEHLGYVNTGQWLYNEFHQVPTYSEFNVEPFITLHVDSSPKAEAIFIEFWGQTGYTWNATSSTGSAQMLSVSCIIKLISPLIPDNIEVITTYGLAGEFSIQHIESPPGLQERVKRSWKFSLDRQSLGWWIVRYIDSHISVPTDQAQIILNDLIDNGFDLELSAEGYTDGVKWFLLYAFQVEVTRLVKK